MSTPRIETRDERDLLEAMQNAVASKTRFDLRGSGRHVDVGRPMDTDQILSLKPMSGVVTYEPDELVLITQAATPLATIVKTLDDAGQMLAFDPPLGALDPKDAQGTIGGVMATNLAGPRRMVSGAARDYLLGFKAISGRGEAFQSGSRVMKNVTGYDLSKLMAGSYGTLAVMHELTLKTMPKPEDAASLIIKTKTVIEAAMVLRQAFASAHEPTAGAILPSQAAQNSSLEAISRASDQGALAVIRIEGFEISVKNRLQALSELLADFGEQMILQSVDSTWLQSEIREASLIPQNQNRVLSKLSCPPAMGGALLAQILAMPEVEAFGDWGGGLLWISHPVSVEAVETLRWMTQSSGGHVTVVSAPESLRRACSVFHPQPQALQALTARVKASFDPLGILNPSRMYEGV